MKEYQIGIVDLAGILRKRKRLIAAATAVCALAAAVVTFSLPRTWEVDAIFYPARISMRNEEGGITSRMIIPFRILSSQLERRELVPYIAEESGLATEDIPRLHIRPILGTNQVRFFLRHRDIGKAERALDALLQILTRSMNEELHRRLERINTVLADLDSKSEQTVERIQAAELEIDALSREQRTAEGRHASSLDEEKTLYGKIRAIEEKIARLEERYEALAARNDPAAARDTLSVSHLILAQALLAGSLTENIRSERTRRYDLDRRMADISEKRALLESRIAALRDELEEIPSKRQPYEEMKAGAIPAHVLKEPGVRSRPAALRKAAAIGLAAVLGFLLSAFPVFFLEIGKLAAKRPGADPED